MKLRELVYKLRKSIKDDADIPPSCVYAYSKRYGLNYSKSTVLSNFIGRTDSISAEKAYNILEGEKSLSFSHLIGIFELLISPVEKKGKGITYTPEEVKRYIIQEVVDSPSVPYICDPSCGCGSFLVTAAECIKKQYGIPYKKIIEKYIFGADINSQAIEQTKVLLSLLALTVGETDVSVFHFICGDMLNPDTFSKLASFIPEGFDCIIGNPPYVRSKNIDVNTRSFLSAWNVSKVGNVDLYIPFFEIGLSLLNKSGKLGYISPNTFLQSVNGRALRNLIKTDMYNLKIIDFRDVQIFDNVTNYTCITVIDKKKRGGEVSYYRMAEEALSTAKSFTQYLLVQFPYDSPWRMESAKNDEIIYCLEHAGAPLESWKIRNGLATLKNDLFFFVPEKEDINYFYRTYKGVQYKIEKNICIKIAKPNVIKSEQELENNKEVAIFPYRIRDTKVCLMQEDEITKNFPNTYQFLMDNKTILQQRDKGNGKYSAWYAYGRTQGMNNFGKKILLPYISGSPIAIISTDEKLLFYCGYALFSDDLDELKILKLFLESDVFWYYIKHTSKPYSKGYMSFAKNYIKNFTIPSLNNAEKRFLLNSTDKKKINSWIWEKYLSGGYKIEEASSSYVADVPS